MKQADLFDRETIADRFTRRGDSIVPPQPDEIARAAGARGMELSADHAERVSRGWQARAVGYVRLHATVHASFMCEDVRTMAEADGFDLPPSKTAWGSVMRQAARDGIVAADGYAPANSSRRGPKSRWRSLLAAGSAKLANPCSPNTTRRKSIRARFSRRVRPSWPIGPR